MILAIKDNDRYWFVTDGNLADIKWYSFPKPYEESLPFFKLKREGKLAGCSICGIEADILRTHPKAFHGELNFASMAYGVDELYDISEKYHHVDTENHELNCGYLVAKDDVCYAVTSGMSVLKISEFYACGASQSMDLLNVLYLKYKDLPLEDKVKSILIDYFKPIDCQVFPIYMMDSKDFKLKILE